MWVQIEKEYLIKDKYYHVVDTQNFVHKAVFDGKELINPVTKLVIKSLKRIWR